MQTDAPDVLTVRRLLENLELKIVLDSPNNDYRFEYFTTSIKDRQTEELRLTRTYRLLDLIRGGVTPEPWDTYDLDKQASLVTNLMRFSRYRMTKIVCGWEAICPVCGYVMSGKIWESIPKTCRNESPRKCRTRIDDEGIKEILLVSI
jgi:hypothetical protein